MTIRAILFLGGFVVLAVGALASPILGVLGYIAHYNIGPESQWWFSSIGGFGIRYSYTLAIATAIGMALNWGRLSWGNRFLVGQEKLVLAFLGLVWLSVLMSEPTHAYTFVDHPSVKLTKVVIFVMLMSHVVTTLRGFDALLWVLVGGGLVLGLEAYETPLSAFAAGRLESVGGPDFRDSNALAAYVAALLPLIGIQFLRSGWKGRLFCVVAGVFTVNGIVLTRSRGAVVGLAAGAVVALLCAPRGYRLRITAGILLGLGGLIYLGDTGFWLRTGTIAQAADERDRSAESRLEIWEGGFQMALANPQGVGAGNFMQTIGRYAPMHADRDAHSTYVRCLGELGFLGLGILAALIVNAAAMLLRCNRQINELVDKGFGQGHYLGYGLLISLTVLLTSGAMGTLTYVEALWWFLALPVCLQRALENAHQASALEEEQLAADMDDDDCDRALGWDPC